MKKIEFYRHNLTEKDKSEVRKVLDSLFLTTGEQVKIFENKLAKYLHTKFVIGVNSCTDALFIALKGLGVSTGDEVITTPMSFIATANSIEYCGARPIFVDVEETTGNINPNLIERAITPKTKAILVVHLYGQMSDMKTISNIAKKHSLLLIEDAAHCIEGQRDGIRVGELSDAACFSFYATKNITSGEGGAIACNSEKLHDYCLKARQHGMSKNAADRYTKRYEHYDMEFLGYKMNMTNIQAALLINQIGRMETYLKKKSEISDTYDLGFNNTKGINHPQILPFTKHAHHIYTVWVNPNKRDQILSFMQDRNIGVAINFRPIHLMKYYRDKYGYKPGNYPVTEKIGSSTITLPMYPKLTKKEIQYVISSLKMAVEQ